MDVEALLTEHRSREAHLCVAVANSTVGKPFLLRRFVGYKTVV